MITVCRCLPRLDDRRRRCRRRRDISCGFRENERRR